MDRVFRVAAIHDLSCFGRGPLSIIIPVLSAMGHQVCPLPTALMSTHTGGFDGYTSRDLSGDMKDILSHWGELELMFDAVYSGYLGGHGQLEAAKDFFDRFAGTGVMRFVDPVLGDDGKLYGGVDADLVEGIRSLISGADVITPNFTEACFLLERPYTDAVPDKAEIAGMLRELNKMGAKRVVITGINLGSHIGAAVYDSTLKHPVMVKNERVDAFFPGTGDLFASVVLGSLLSGVDLVGAVDRAAAYCHKLIRFTIEAGTPWREGVLLEKHLKDLVLGGYSRPLEREELK